MADISILRTTDLKPDERVTVEKMLGHPLHDDEAVALSAFRPHPALAGEAKRQAASKLHEIIERRADKVQHLPVDEIEQAINGAMEDVRRRATTPEGSEI